MKSNKDNKNINLAYKIRMVVDIQGEVSGQPPLKQDTGIYPFMEWAVNDIEQKLQGECEIIDVTAVELKQVED